LGARGDYDYHCGFLEAHVNHRYRVLESIAFRGSVVRLYERIPAAQPILR
jgi:hypothetical protein